MKKNSTIGLVILLTLIIKRLIILVLGVAIGIGAQASTITAVTAKYQSSPLISNITAGSGKSYTATGLATGVRTYTDRTYQVTSMPPLLTGSFIIQTANDDKQNTSSSFLSFDLSQSSTIYVAYDPRATALPSWLSGWQKLTDRIGFDDSKISYMELYSKTFPAGRVSLGGNMASPAAGAQTNYFVVAKQSTSTTNSLSFSPTTLNYSVVQGGSVSTQSTTLSASSGTPVVTLSKSTANWLTLPASSLGTLSFGPSNINTNLTPGTYQATVTATASNYQSATLQINLTVTHSGSTFSEKKINFQPASSSAPTGYIQDNGLPYDGSRGYGWVDPSTKLPQDLTANMRIRSGTDELRLRTLTQMQATDKGQLPGSWEYTLPNGLYNVTVSAGDPSYYDSNHRINIEGVTAISNFIPTSSLKYRSATTTVQVNDGKLTIDANGGTNTKINYVIITPASSSGDNIPPAVSIALSGALLSPGVYANEATVTINASDTGGSGLSSVQYSLNNGAYVTYTSAFKISAAGSYTIRAKAVDGSNNQTITDATNFSIVKSTQSNTYMVVENMDKFQAPDRLTFSLIQIPWRRLKTDGTYTPYNENHNKVTLKISNKGSGALTISNLTFSNTSAWKIAALNGAAYNASSSLPITLSTGASVEAVVEFTAKDLGGRVKLLNDKLFISSNDPNTPYREIKLHGLWQYRGEDIHEPYAQEIINAFGFKTRVGFSATDGTSKGNTLISNSDEVLSAYFLRADATKPVSVIQMAAYHGCCADTETFQWYDKGGTTNRTVFSHNPLDGQSLLPRKSGSTTVLAQGTFTPAGTFGFKIQRSYSDRTKNFEGKIGMRIWKAIDANGNIIPNAYIIGMDYLTSPYVNYDYQDNIYYVSNVKPEIGAAYYSELSATPSATDFGALLTGASKSMSVTLKNLGKTYSNGSSDPSITITGIEIVGPNKTEFTAAMPSTSTLSPQASVGITAMFRPGSLGIKNAALLVYYNNAMSPLRIPLYGIANTSTSTISIAKRIKGAADANVTIGGKLWEADINYRRGNIKLDRPGATPIEGTDDDVLYQTYLSSNADLDEIRYEIPITNGNYNLRMHFAENFWSAAGARVFHINSENVTQLFNFDVFNEVGFKAALVKDFEVSVNDGVLNLKFNPTANRLALAGVEIFKVVSGSNAMATESTSSALLENELDNNLIKLQVYPNPSSGENLHIELEGLGKQESVKIELYDMAGRVLQTADLITDNEGINSSQITLNKKLSRGMYIIRASTSSGGAHTKLIID